MSTPRRLRGALRAYRIGDPAGDHPVYICTRLRTHQILHGIQKLVP